MSLSTVRIGDSGLDLFLCVLHGLSPWVGCFGMKITDAVLSAGVLMSLLICLYEESLGHL